ncbi:MAG: hypothetical protein U0869_02905 [Chloroflexota bacterium]
MNRSASSLLQPRAMLPILALALSGALFMGAGPAPSGHGPMAAVPPASQVPLPTGPLFPAPSVDPLDAKSGSGAGATVPMPAELVGAWYTGNVGSIGYVDPTTGSYSDGSSTAEAYTFYPDGTWQYAWMISSTLYGCSMRTVVFREGTIAAADEAKHYADLDTTRSQMHSEDACVDANNYDRELPPDDDTIIWERTTDQYGEVLMLRGPNTAFSPFRPAQAGS